MEGPPPPRQPHLVILIGIPATGKTTFALERFAHTHLRLSRDVLRTSYREWQLFDSAIRTTTDVVVDNTNVTRAERSRFISAAKPAGYRIDGYYFESRLADALVRNAARAEAARIPDAAVGGKSAALELPAAEEGFDRLFFLRLHDDGFIVEDWNP